MYAFNIVCTFHIVHGCEHGTRNSGSFVIEPDQATLTGQSFWNTNCAYTNRERFLQVLEHFGESLYIYVCVGI